MIHLNIHEAKTHLSRYLEQVEKGETLVLCRRNVPIAEIRPLAKARQTPRPIGLAREEYGDYEVTESFFEPLPDWLLDGFSGDEP